MKYHAVSVITPVEQVEFSGWTIAETTSVVLDHDARMQVTQFVSDVQINVSGSK